MAKDIDGLFFKPEEELKPMIRPDLAGIVSHPHRDALRQFFSVLRQINPNPIHHTRPVESFSWEYAPYYHRHGQRIPISLTKKPGIAVLAAFYGTAVTVTDMCKDTSTGEQNKKSKMVVHGLANLATLLQRSIEGSLHWPEARMKKFTNRENVYGTAVQETRPLLSAFYSPDRQSFGVEWMSNRPGVLLNGAEDNLLTAQLRSDIHAADDSHELRLKLRVAEWKKRPDGNNIDYKVPNMLSEILGEDRCRVVLGRGSLDDCRRIQANLMDLLQLTFLHHPFNLLPPEPADPNNIDLEELVTIPD